MLGTRPAVPTSYSPLSTVSSYSSCASRGTGVGHDDYLLAEALDDFDAPAVSSGVVSALAGVVQALLPHSVCDRFSVCHEQGCHTVDAGRTQLLCSAAGPRQVPGRTHNRDSPEHPGLTHNRDCHRQPDSQASVQAVLHRPVPGRRHHRDTVHSAAPPLLVGPPSGGGTDSVQQAARVMQSYVRRTIARHHFAHMLMEREWATYARRHQRAISARAIQTIVRGVHARRRCALMLMMRENARYACHRQRALTAQTLQALVRGALARRRCALLRPLRIARAGVALAIHADSAGGALPVISSRADGALDCGLPFSVQRFADSDADVRRTVSDITKEQVQRGGGRGRGSGQGRRAQARRWL